MRTLVRDQEQYIRMTQTPIPQLITKLAVPTVISMLVTAVYNTADTFFVAMLDDTAATGAVGVVFSLMSLIHATSFMVGVGCGSWISRLLGRQERREAGEVGTSGLVMVWVVGMLLVLYGALFDTAPLLRMLGSTETILPHAKAYAEYILYGAPMMMSGFVLNNVLRAEGHATYSMLGIAFGGILNMFLDPFFILPWGLGMGVGGAALATAISQTISMFILLLPFFRGKTEVKLAVGSISKKAVCYARIVRYGLPSLTRQGLASVASIVLNLAAAAAAGALADQAIAAMSLVSKVFMMVFSIMIGIGQGFQPVMGYNYGARRFDRAREAFWFLAKSCTVIMTICGVLGFFFAENLIGVFGSAKSDLDVLRIGTYALRAQCLVMPLLPLSVTCNMTMQSTGQAAQATFLAACRQGICLLPMLLILPHFIGLAGVQIAQAVADVISFAICVPFTAWIIRDFRAKEAAVLAEKSAP